MIDPSPPPAVDAAADTTDPGRSPTFERRWAASASEQLERTRLIEQARHTDAAAQLRRCCPSAARVLESLSWRALTRLAANEPVDPNDPDSWRSPDAHAQIVLRRHGITGLDSTRLTMDAVRALIDGQARADRDAGLDWTRLDVPAAPARRSAAARARAAADRARRPGDLRLPRRPAPRARRPARRRRRAGRRPLALAARPPRRLRRRRPALLADRLGHMAGARRRAAARRSREVERPVGLFLAPAERGEGWQLAPVLSLDAIRLLALARRPRRVRPALGGAARSAPAANCSNASTRTRCTPGRTSTSTPPPGSPRRSRASSARASARAWRARSATAGDACSSGAAPCTGPRRRRGPELVLRVLTIAGRAFPRRRVGAAPRDEHAAQPSAAMELGEAVQTAIERELPLLLSSEAAGQLQRHGPRRAHEGPPRRAGDHHRRRGVGEHPARRRRAGDARAARAARRRGER